MKRLLSLALLAAFAAVLPLSGHALAQDPPVASKQQLALEKFRALNDRMRKLQAVLANTAPEDSRLLDAGNRFIQEKRIHEQMATVKQKLDGEHWDQALEDMKVVRQDLTRLLELLQNRDADLLALMEQIAKLQAFRDRVDGLVQEQSKEKGESARTEELQKQLEAIAKAKEQAERILREQKELRGETNQQGMAAAPATAKALAARESKLRDDTEKLGKDLDKLDKKAAELAQTKPGEGKPGEGAQPGSGGACASCAGSAAQAMGQAQQKLGDNQPESSLKDQDQAIEKLEQAIAEMEKMADEARRELEKLPFEQQAKNQDKTQVDTDTLAKDMEKAEQAEDGEAAKPTPGRKNVQQAVPKQRAAAGQLKEYKPATQKQQDAKEDLEKARDELDEALAQLRQQLQDEVLRALEERFGAMLHKQRELSALTKTVDRTRKTVLTGDGSLPTALVQQIGDIAGGEFELGTEAADALKLLEEEGSTAVFPEIVTALRDDLYAVSKRLRANETGQPVQQMQAEIEETLAMLINALRRTIELREGGGNCNCNGQPQLVPISAELKMIRYLQERVNKRTIEYDTAVPEAERETALAKEEAKVLSGRQVRVRDLTRKLAAKLGKENHAEGEGR